MAVKYVKDFIFGPMTSVQRYAKGGHVTKVPAKAKPAAKGMPARAKPNAPAKGAKRMESPPKMGKGQGYKDGGKVPGKKMDRLPTKTPPGRDKDLAPAKPFKGAYEGYNKGGKARRYAEGGDVQDPRFASIEPGAGSPLDAGAPRTMKTFDYSEPSREIPLNQYGEADPFGGRPVRDITLEPYRPIPVDEIPSAPLIDNFRSVTSPVPTERDFSEFMRRNEERVRNDMAQQKRDLAEIQRQTGSYSPAGSDSAAYQALTGNRPVGPEVLPRPGIDFKVPTRPYDPGVVEPLEPSPYRPVDELMRGEPQMYKAEVGPGPSIAYEDPAYYQNYLRRVQAELNEPPMARAVQNVGANRAVGLGDIMAAARAQGMMRRPGMPQTAMYAKGGHVKGQAKVGKVMGEYKRGELHSGSKKGPLVKNPKQAVAIALSEARKSGAKIAKKAEGGLSDKELGGKSFAGRNEPLRGRYVSREEKIMREAVAKEKQKDMERKMREAYERTQSQSVSGLKKGGMARKGVPTHKAKAMYGGGKC